MKPFAKLVFFLVTAVLGMCIGWVIGSRQVLGLEARRIVNSIYDHQKSRHELSELAKVGLCGPSCVARLSAFKTKHGDVESWRIQEVSFGIMSLPVVVRVYVEREDGPHVEEIVIHSPGQAYDAFEAGEQNARQ